MTCEESVIAKILIRQQQGFAKYGVTMERTDLSRMPSCSAAASARAGPCSGMRWSRDCGAKFKFQSLEREGLV